MSAPGTISLFARNGMLKPLADIEAEAIKNAVELHGIVAAARALGIARGTLTRKLKALGLSVVRSPVVGVIGGNGRPWLGGAR